MTPDTREQLQWLKMNAETHVDGLTAAEAKGTVGKWHLLRAELLRDAVLTLETTLMAAPPVATDGETEGKLSEETLVRLRESELLLGQRFENFTVGDLYYVKDSVTSAIAECELPTPPADAPQEKV